MRTTPSNVLTMTGVSTLMHFLVDGLCVCCLYLMVPAVDAGQIFGMILTYNVMAFMSQPFTGILADRVKQMHWLLLIASLLLTLSVLSAALLLSMGTGIPKEGAWLVAFLLGCGNSLFHVWGGKQTVLKWGNDMRAIGVFVSSGALGLSVGFVCCSWLLLYIFLLAICLLGLVYVRMDLAYDEDAYGGHSAPDGLRWGATLVWAALVALILVVMLRSYVGENLTSGTAKTPWVLLLFGATAMFGKIAGGWLACRFGIVKSMAVVVLAVVGCYLYRGAGMPVLLLGLLMINCTMPVTLYLANAVLKDREGLAFGLLAAALLPGYLLAVW